MRPQSTREQPWRSSTVGSKIASIPLTMQRKLTDIECQRSNNLRFRGNILRSQGNILRFRGNNLRSRGNNLRSLGNILRSQGNNLRFQGNILRSQGNILRFWGNNLRLLKMKRLLTSISSSESRANSSLTSSYRTPWMESTRPSSSPTPTSSWSSKLSQRRSLWRRVEVID